MQIYKTVDIKSTNRKKYECHGIHAILLSMCSPPPPPPPPQLFLTPYFSHISYPKAKKISLPQ